jgi:hypothetical protein
MSMTEALTLRNWLTSRGFTLRPMGEHVKVIPFWRLSDDERTELWRLEPHLAKLLTVGWLSARQEELSTRSQAFLVPDGTPRCWWCGAPAKRDGCHMCEACAVSRRP